MRSSEILSQQIQYEKLEFAEADDPNQMTLWPTEKKNPRLVPPGPDYPWRFHERVQHYKTRLVHPALAVVLAEEDVRNETRALEREARKLRPTLWDAVA